jgi:predicted nucleotide-binding protein (sugar kinase/HSP70/actin superfamily)
MNDMTIKSRADVDGLIDEIGITLPPEEGKAEIIARSSEQYVEQIHHKYVDAEQDTTTVLLAGFTDTQDLLLVAAIRGEGFRVKALDTPDNRALRYGKEFGNRGQCNPTYFTSGNLVKYLVDLRDKEGIPVEDIIKNNVFLTFGACGPCRFGTYSTEYRKALRDAGFDGFRILSVSQTAGANQTVGEGGGFKISKRLVVKAIQSFVIGDILNALMYRIRPYEVNKGDTDRAIAECRKILGNAFAQRRSLAIACHQCKKLLEKIEVDRSQIKPRVAIIGEFWAMTTEGDGNYKLQRFLESEGAEVDVQSVTAWILYLIWQARFDTNSRKDLQEADGGRRGLKGISARQRLLKAALAEKALLSGFKFFSRLMGLKDYKFQDMNELAQISSKHYDSNIRGGEGHMEVGKLICNVEKNKVNMTLSVKPFGCMPSSGVSDGVQSLITERYPKAIFLPLETTGDGAVNAYSRVQMQLFKARQRAQQEFSEALQSRGITEEQYKASLEKRGWHRKALHRSPHRFGCSAADLAQEVVTSGLH